MADKAPVAVTHLHGSFLESSVDLVAFVAFGDPTKDSIFKLADKALGGVLSDIAQSESFDGKTGQQISVHSHGKLPAKRVVVIGGGTKGEFGNPSIRDLSAAVAQHANKVGAKTVAFLVPTFGANREAALIQHATEGVFLGTYKFGRYLTGEDHKKPTSLASFGLVTDPTGKKKPTAKQGRDFTTAIERGITVANAINHARDLINEPAHAVTPSTLAADAQAIGKKHKATLSVTVLDAKKCAELGMGMFLAVGQGSDQEPRFIHMTYKPAKKAKKKLCFIGKGITFDSGGYSLKPSASMEDMKVDMSGAAAVISAMDAIATLGSPHEVHVVAACFAKIG